MEGIRLYRPLPHLEPFHASPAKWRVLDGSNRSSKTMSGAAEAVRAWLGCDPYDKYVPRNGNALVVGMKLEQVAMIWHKCAHPGASKIIRDEETRMWRSVRPDPAQPDRLDPYDEAYREKWKDAPPLIPPRMIAGRIAWEERAKGIPSFVRFKTGWKVHFNSSNSKPPQGDHYTFCWVDEEMINAAFLDEMKRGLTGLDEIPKHRPRAIWSATAQTTNPELLEMREQADQGSEYVHAFQALIKDNPYVPEDEKRAFHDSLSEDDRRVRYYGEYAMAGRRCYPTFDPQGIHGFDPREIPSHWCRYVGLDPGSQHCGTIFMAVDPNEQHAWIYDGFDLRNADATTWGQRIAARPEQFEAFVIDARAGKQKTMGLEASNVASAYWGALRAADVKPRQMGPMQGFFPGSEDVAGRQEALRGWMAVRPHGPHAGTPRLKVARGCLPDLEKQIRRAHMDPKQPDKRAKPAWDKFHEDMLVCVEYLAAFNPRYFEPAKPEEEQGDDTWQRFQEAQRRMGHREAARGEAVCATVELG
jgi:hypothetical protein